MNLKIKLVGLLLLLCNTMYAQSNTTFEFSLQQAIDYAMQNQNAVKNAKLDKQISEQKIKETIAIGLPQVNGKATAQKFLDIPTQVIPNFISPSVYGVLIDNNVKDGNGNPIKMPAGGYNNIEAKFGTTFNMSYGVDVSQLIFDGSYLVGLQATNVYKDLTVKALERTQNEARVAVTKAYYAVLVVQKSKELLDANVTRLKKTLDDTKAYYDNGFAEKIDVDRLTVIYNNIVTERENLERVYIITANVLKFQMGMPIESDLILTDKLDEVLAVETMPLEAANVQARVEYQLVKTQMRLMELDYKRNIFSRMPTVAAFGTFSKNAQNNDYAKLTDKLFPTSIVGLSITIPLVGSGKKFYQTNQAKLVYEKSKNDLKNLENALSLESKSAQTNFKNSSGQLKNQSKNMELATEVLRVAKIKYNQGVGSSLEVVSAETALKEAENNYIAALYNALIAKVELDKTYGK